MQFENFPKNMSKSELKNHKNPFDNLEKKSMLKIALNQEIYNNLHRSLKHVDSKNC